ncbi:MAG: hypothetical protein U9Q07_03220, partial [Planctomycetota bacterium]|nr:hypothetical protein [Planctomycetota bacterium]
PGCVTYHPFGSFALGNCVIQNFNDKAVNVTLTIPIQEGKPNQFVDAFSGKPVAIRPARSKNNVTLDLPIRARGRVWVRPEQGVRCAVEVEEVVTKYAPANNGAGPLWCYGSTVIARQGDDVYLSTIETGKDVPPLCNTRWQLWHRSQDGWRIAQNEEEYRQREPCPIAVFQRGPVFLSVNPSTEPVGTQYGRCNPLVLEFDREHLAGPAKTLTPAWADGTYFTDHSYRGFAADGHNGELLLVNINARTSEQFVSYRDNRGQWHRKGKITFPVRSCYPQVALRDGSAHMMAIGDIVEPVKEWQKLKFEKLKRKWDYVFRLLFYTYTDDIKTAGFRSPVEIDTVERTGGHIRNLDLHVDKTGLAHLLYLKQPHQYAFLRDKYFPGQPMTVHLEYAVVRDGKVLLRKTLAREPSKSGLEPSFARFHVDSNERLYVIAAGTANRTFGNYLGRIRTGRGEPNFQRITLEHPFRNFFTNTPRGGSQPSDIIDLFGIADDNPNLRYARIRIGTARN